MLCDLLCVCGNVSDCVYCKSAFFACFHVAPLVHFTQWEYPVKLDVDTGYCIPLEIFSDCCQHSGRQLPSIVNI